MRRALPVLALWLLTQVAPATTASGADGSAGPVPYRLGTAAGPFGWSTLIADFNGDAAPDVAVADEVGHASGAYVYSLEIAVSGTAPFRATFESVQPALQLRVEDVDGDRDPDIVVCVPLSQRSISVWLNDGRGHFVGSEVSSAPAERVSTDSIDTPRREREIASWALPAPRETNGPETSRFHLDDRNRTSFVAASACLARRPLIVRLAQVRAPPA
jgi:hypothetical protein